MSYDDFQEILKTLVTSADGEEMIDVAKYVMCKCGHILMCVCVCVRVRACACVWCVYSVFIACFVCA